MNEGRKIRPKSQIMLPSTSPMGRRNNVCDSLPRYENEREIREREIKELRQQITQMEKTMRWWSDCTTNWREKWSQVKCERNAAREELKSTKTQLFNLQREVELLRNTQGFERCGSGREQSSQMFLPPRKTQQRKKVQTDEVTILDDETLATFEERISRLSFKLDESRAVISEERDENVRLHITIERLERDLSDLQELYESVKKELYEINGKEYGESELDSFAGELEGSEIEELQIQEAEWYLRNGEQKTTLETVEVNLPVKLCNNMVSEVTIPAATNSENEDAECLAIISTNLVEMTQAANASDDNDSNGLCDTEPIESNEVENAKGHETPVHDDDSKGQEDEGIFEETTEQSSNPDETNPENSDAQCDPIVKTPETTPELNVEKAKTPEQEEKSIRSGVLENSDEKSTTQVEIAKIVEEKERNEEKSNENVNSGIVPENTTEKKQDKVETEVVATPDVSIDSSIVPDIVCGEDDLVTFVRSSKEDKRERVTPKPALPESTPISTAVPVPASTNGVQKIIRTKSAKSESRIPLKKTNSTSRKTARSKSHPDETNPNSAADLPLPSTVL